MRSLGLTPKAQATKSKNRNSRESSNFTSGDLSRGNQITISKRYLYPLFIETLFPKAKTWKQPKCPSTDDLRKKILYIICKILNIIHNEILFSHKKEPLGVLPFYLLVRMLPYSSIA